MKLSTLGLGRPSIRGFFSAFSVCSYRTGLIKTLQHFVFIASIALLLAAFVSPTARAASFPTQKLFYDAISLPTLNFQTGQAGCEYIASQSRDGNGFYHYTNALWIPNDPTSGNICQFTYYYLPTSQPQTTIAQGWIIPMGDFCPQGYAPSNGVCTCTDATLCPKAPPACEADGNPILRGYGIKRQLETDYISSSLRFERIYNSVQSANDYRLQWTVDVPLGGFGKRWLHTYSRVVDVVSNGTLTSALVYRPDGGLLAFQQNGGSWIPEADVADTLMQQTDGSGNLTGWTYHVGATDDTETYNAKGILQIITNRAGVKQTLTYSTSSTPASIAPAPNLLINVTDSFGRQFNFTYDSKTRMTAMTDPDGGKYLYTYNGYNELTSVQYPDSKTRAYLYDESAYSTNTSIGALTGITDENGQRFATFTYSNNKATSTYHAGNVDKYSLTYGSNQTTVTDPRSSARTYNFQTTLGVVKGTTQSQPGGAGCGPSSSAATYDSSGNIASRTDFNGNVTKFTYDLTRNLETSRTEAYGSALARTISTTWHSTYRLPTLITEPGKTTAFTYDANGNLLSKTLTDTALNTARTWSYTYNALGQVLTADGPRSDVSDITTYTYYASSSAGNYTLGDLATVTNALGHITRITRYDANGRPLSITDPNGVVTTLSYDARGRLLSRSINGAQTTTYAYDGVGQLLKATLPDSSYVSYSYDAAHRLTDIGDSVGNKIHYTLDAMGNRLQEDTKDPSSALAKTRSRVFDALNRLQKDIGGTNPSAQITQYAYDNNGNLTSITDPLNHVTTNGYDALNRLVSITDPANGVATNTYNGLDQLTQVKDPRLVTTNYTIDALGNVSLTQSPDSGSTQNTYDAAGNLIKKIDARNIESDYSYDALNRVTGVTYPANPAENATFSYDSTTGDNKGVGKLTAYSNDGGSTALVYDSYGNLAQQSDVIQAANYAAGYQYDSANRLSQITYPSGRIVTYTRNSLGQVAEVSMRDSASAPVQTVLGNVGYEPFGPVSSLSFGNGVITTILHDRDYRIAHISASTAPAWDFVYTYDAAGNIQGLADQAGSYNKTLGYDALNRVTADTNNTGNWSYQYDAGGNRTQRVKSGGTSLSPDTQTLTYASSANRLTSNGTRAISLDAAGNLISNGGNLNYAYNNANRLSSYAQMSSVIASLRYNALGQRVAKLQVGYPLSFHYGQRGELLGFTAFTSSGLLYQRVDYIWLDDTPVAQIRTTYASSGAVSSQRFTYIHADHLNTPRAMSDSTGKIVWRWDGDAYGSMPPNQNPDGDSTSDTLNLRFPGQFYDQEMGLYYNVNRYYDPAIGRYVQSDPIGLEGGLNLYVYANANPISFIDPNGLIGIGNTSSPMGGQKGAGSGGGPISSVGISGTIGSTTIGVSTNGTGWGQTTQLGVGVGVEACINIPKEDPCKPPPSTPRLPDSYSVGIGKNLGLQFNNNGSICINAGPSFGLPAGVGWNL